MAVRPWNDTIKKRKVLTIFATPKIKGLWRKAFDEAIAEFNTLSTKSLNLGITFDASSSVTKPDPVGEGGAEVQFEVGNGKLLYEAMGQKFVAKDRQGKEISFSPTDLHGATEKLSLSFGGPALTRRAFIFVPETPMVNALMKVGNGPNAFRSVPREAGLGIRKVIAFHELIHASGLSNDEHNFQGPDADAFTIAPSANAGAFDRPQDDKLLLHLASPQPNVFAPPLTIKTKVADLIRNNWK